MGGASSESMVEALDLSGDSYSLEAQPTRVTDGQGRPILEWEASGVLKDETKPFVTPEGEPVASLQPNRVKVGYRQYELVDEGTGEPFALSGQKPTFTSPGWRIRDPESEKLLFTVKGAGVLGLLRNIGPLKSVLPVTYAVRSPDDRKLGEISRGANPYAVKDVGFTADLDTRSKLAVLLTAQLLNYEKS